MYGILSRQSEGPKEGSSTSVSALSVYSDGAPHFGGVQSSRSDKK